MRTDRPPLRLNCTRCQARTEYAREGTVVRCDACGKRHATDSLVVDFSA